MTKIEPPTAGSIVRQATFNHLGAVLEEMDQNVSGLDRTANGRGARVTITAESRDVDAKLRQAGRRANNRGVR